MDESCLTYFWSRKSVGNSSKIPQSNRLISADHGFPLALQFFIFWLAASLSEAFSACFALASSDSRVLSLRTRLGYIKSTMRLCTKVESLLPYFFAPFGDGLFLFLAVAEDFNNSLFCSGYR